MPFTKDINIDTTKKVVVTGATGYVAGAIIQQLLQSGVTVHATVRDAGKRDKFQHLQDIADASPGSVHFFRADLTRVGSFQQAMEGASIVFHTASPFVVNTTINPQKDLIDPAVKGTGNVLGQASKTSTVERVVLTSSCAAIYGDASDTLDAPGQVLKEDVWNRTSSKQNGAYSLSKTLAEQKAWEIAGSQTQWKLVVINPSFVLGPGVKSHPNSESFKIMRTIGGGQSELGVPGLAVPVVDVRDVAAAQLAAAYLPDAQGRHILCAANSDFAEVGLTLKEKYGETYPVPARKLPVPRFLGWLLAPLFGLSRRTMYRNLNVKTNLDSAKAKQQLGIEFRPMKRTIEDMVSSKDCVDRFRQLSFESRTLYLVSFSSTNK